MHTPDLTQMLTEQHSQLSAHPFTLNLIDTAAQAIHQCLVTARQRLHAVRTNVLLAVQTLEQQGDTVNDINIEQLVNVQQLEHAFTAQCETATRQLYSLALTHITTAPAQPTLPPQISIELDTQLQADMQAINDELRSRYHVRKHKSFPPLASIVLNQFYTASPHNAYPSAEVKMQLAEQCGISYDQIQHWFINRRMRTKPAGAARKRRNRASKPQKRAHSSSDSSSDATAV